MRLPGEMGRSVAVLHKNAAQDLQGGRSEVLKAAAEITTALKAPGRSGWEIGGKQNSPLSLPLLPRSLAKKFKVGDKLICLKVLELIR